MSKIYVITAGEYSDYQVYGTTTDPERAEIMKKIVDAHLGTLGDAEIEEYEDGIFEDERLSTIVPVEYWRVYLKTGSSEVTAYKISADRGKTMEIHEWPFRGKWEYDRNRMCPVREVGTEYLVTYIRADSEEEAIKIAVDQIMKYRVEKGELGQ